MAQDLAALQAQIKKELMAQRDMLPPPTISKINLKNKRFTVPGESPTEGPLKCIVLDWRYQNNYFEGIYNSNNPIPPSCSASSKNSQVMSPSADSAKPQSVDCSDCPQNAWGSDPGGKGKACKNSVRLAIVPVNPTADMVPWVIDVSPTGMTSFNNYVHLLQNTYELLPMQMETEISFDQGVDYPSLRFKSLTTHEYLGAAMALRNAVQPLLAA